MSQQYVNTLNHSFIEIKLNKMNTLATSFINSLKEGITKDKDDILNRRFAIDLNNYFKETDRIEIKGKFVRACNYPLPIPERIIISNDMSKYKLTK